jgi:hypothetical protein
LAVSQANVHNVRSTLGTAPLPHSPGHYSRKEEAGLLTFIGNGKIPSNLDSTFSPESGLWTLDSRFLITIFPPNLRVLG